MSPGIAVAQESRRTVHHEYPLAVFSQAPYESPQCPPSPFLCALLFKEASVIFSSVWCSHCLSCDAAVFRTPPAGVTHAPRANTNPAPLTTSVSRKTRSATQASISCPARGQRKQVTTQTVSRARAATSRVEPMGTNSARPRRRPATKANISPHDLRSSRTIGAPHVAPPRPGM